MRKQSLVESAPYLPSGAATCGDLLRGIATAALSFNQEVVRSIRTGLTNENKSLAEILITRGKCISELGTHLGTKGKALEAKFAVSIHAVQATFAAPSLAATQMRIFT